MTLERLITTTDKGDRIFYSALQMNFGDNADSIVDYLINNEYAEKIQAYRCPNCNLLIIETDSEFCYHCDAEINYNHLTAEPLLIRTDKKLTDAEIFARLQTQFMKYVEYAFGDIVDIEDWSYLRGAVYGVWQTVCHMKHIGKIDTWQDVIDKYNEIASAIVSPEYEYKEFKGSVN